MRYINSASHISVGAGSLMVHLSSGRLPDECSVILSISVDSVCCNLGKVTVRVHTGHQAGASQGEGVRGDDPHHKPSQDELNPVVMQSLSIQSSQITALV